MNTYHHLFQDTYIAFFSKSTTWLSESVKYYPSEHTLNPLSALFTFNIPCKDFILSFISLWLKFSGEKVHCRSKITTYPYEASDINKRPTFKYIFLTIVHTFLYHILQFENHFYLFQLYQRSLLIWTSIILNLSALLPDSWKLKIILIPH